MKRFTNANARHYRIEGKLEAGLILSGGEVKEVRTRGIQLTEAMVQLKDGEAYLVNASVAPYQFARTEAYDPKRTRKLLLKKGELSQLISKRRQGLTIIPLACYTKSGWIKILLGLGKKRKKVDKKRELIEKQARKEIKKHF